MSFLTWKFDGEFACLSSAWKCFRRDVANSCIFAGRQHTSALGHRYLSHPHVFFVIPANRSHPAFRTFQVWELKTSMLPQHHAPSSDSVLRLRTSSPESSAERLASSPFLALTNTHHRRPSFDEPRTHTLEMTGFGGDRKYVVRPPIIPDSIKKSIPALPKPAREDRQARQARQAWSTNVQTSYCLKRLALFFFFSRLCAAALLPPSVLIAEPATSIQPQGVRGPIPIARILDKLTGHSALCSVTGLIHVHDRSIAEP